MNRQKYFVRDHGKQICRQLSNQTSRTEDTRKFLSFDMRFDISEWIKRVAPEQKTEIDKMHAQTETHAQ